MGAWPDGAHAELRASSNEAQEKKEGVMSRTRTIVCGVDSSRGRRAAGACRCLASRRVRCSTGSGACARPLGDRFPDGGACGRRILYDEAPDAGAEARGEAGDVAERLAAVA